MKRLTLFLLLVCLIQWLFAQDKVVHFVYPQFKPATVLYNNGNVSNTELNYNKATEEMVYTDPSGKRMALYPIDKIDTVFLAEKKFVPVGRVFYEVAGVGKYPLYIAHKCRMSLVSSNVGYGNSSTTAVENISSLASSGEVYQLKLPDNYKASPSTIYYVKINNEFVKINKLKDLAALFPNKEKDLTAFIKKDKLKNNEGGYLKLLDYITTLTD